MGLGELWLRISAIFLVLLSFLTYSVLLSHSDCDTYRGGGGTGCGIEVYESFAVSGWMIFYLWLFIGIWLMRDMESCVRWNLEHATEQAYDWALSYSSPLPWLLVTAAEWELDPESVCLRGSVRNRPRASLWVVFRNIHRWFGSEEGRLKGEEKKKKMKNTKSKGNDHGTELWGPVRNDLNTPNLGELGEAEECWIPWWRVVSTRWTDTEHVDHRTWMGGGN